MFTGLIQAIGEITAIDKQGDWTVTIAALSLLKDIEPGASIACNGICVTAVSISGGQFKAQFSAETLSKTTVLHWRPGLRLNLERALRAGDELGGHLVSGHVDGIARVIERRQDQDSLRYRFEVPEAFAKFIAPKGSIAIDGISLTVNEAQGARFGANIIPYTQKLTTLANVKEGGEVNFEIDTIARYVERMTRAT